MPATRTGLAAPTAAFTGFGTDWFDYDNDGWLDLFVANGAVNVIEALRGQPRPFRMTQSAVPQHRQGPLRGRVATAGPAFARAEVGRGAAFGDIDNDGDIDIVVTNNGGPVSLLINRAASTNHWLSLQSSPELREPLRVRRNGRCRARRTADAVAARADRRQLSVGQRLARPFRPRLVVGRGRGRRPLAGR